MIDVLTEIIMRLLTLLDSFLSGWVDLDLGLTPGGETFAGAIAAVVESVVNFITSLLAAGSP